MTATLEPTAPPASPGHRSRVRRHLDLLLLWGALPFVLVGLARATAFAEGDTYWQVATGAEILARRTTSLVEDDSWTAAGTPWHPNSWLYDVLLERAWALGGWAGLGWFALVTVSGVGVAVAVVGRALGATAPALAAVSAAAAIPAVGWLSVRPQTVSYALLVLLVWSAGRVVLGHGLRSLLGGSVVVLALTSFWVDVHLAALSGLAAVAGGAALSLLAGPWRSVLRGRLPAAADLARAVRPAVVVVAVGVGCLTSPLRTDILGAADHTARASSDVITEWAPLWRADGDLVLTWAAAALALLLLVSAWWVTARRGVPQAWLPMWTGAVAALLLAGVTAGRFSAMALVLAVPAVAAVAPRLVPAHVPWLVSRLCLTLPAAVAAAVLVVAVSGLASFGRPGPLFPDTATIAAVPDGCRVLNEYNDGGLLTLLRGSDGVLVAVDGRNDVYGTDVLRWTDQLVHGQDDALATLAERGVGCLLLAPDRPLVGQAEAAGWRVTARDDARVLLVAP